MVLLSGTVGRLNGAQGVRCGAARQETQARIIHLIATPSPSVQTHSDTTAQRLDPQRHHSPATGPTAPATILFRGILLSDDFASDLTPLSRVHRYCIWNAITLLNGVTIAVAAVAATVATAAVAAASTNASCCCCGCRSDK